MLYERSPRNNVIRSPWAIKKLNKRISIKSEYAKRLEEEAEILKKLQHPNIIGYRGRYQETVKITSRNPANNCKVQKSCFKFLLNRLQTKWWRHIDPCNWKWTKIFIWYIRRAERRGWAPKFRSWRRRRRNRRDSRRTIWRKASSVTRTSHTKSYKGNCKIFVVRTI